LLEVNNGGALSVPGLVQTAKSVRHFKLSWTQLLLLLFVFHTLCAA